MPTYVYRCLDCDKRFEVQQSFSDDALTVCNCENAAPVRKVFTPVGVTFKGSGFYKNDSRGKSTGASASSTGSTGSTDKAAEAAPAAPSSTTATSSGTDSSTGSGTVSTSSGTD
jgi:putative FmdB family regulatory protein